MTILYALTALCVVTQSVGLTTVTSALFAMTFPAVWLTWLYSVRGKLTGNDLLLLLTGLLSAVSVLLGGLRQGTIPEWSALKKPVIFLTTLLFFQSASRLEGDIRKPVDRLGGALTVFFAVLCFLWPDRVYRINGIPSRYLTLGFTNPNLAAMFLLCLYMLRLYILAGNGKWGKKLTDIVLALILGILIFKTRARNCIWMLVVFTALWLWLMLRSQRPWKLSRPVAAGIAWFPAIFPPLYLLAMESAFIRAALSFLTGEGKPLHSREAVWKGALRHIGKFPLMGDLSGAQAAIGAGHCHNTHLEIALCYGVVVLICVCILVCRWLHRHGTKFTSRQEGIAMVAFGCGWILGMAEAAVVSGGLGIYIPVGIFLALSHCKDGKEAAHEAAQ